MYIAVFLALLYITIVRHEFAHLDEFLNNGLKVREFGVGIKKGPRISYTPKTGKYKGVRFSLYLCTFFLWAFVEVEDGVLKLPYKKKALALCAGSFANINFGCLLYILLFASVFVPSLYAHDTSSWNMTDWILYLWYSVTSSPCLYIPLAAIPTLWFGRRIISTYLGPLLGIGLIVAHFYTGSLSLSVVEYVSDVTGPIGFVADLPSMATNMWTAVEWAAQMSFALGALNLLPIAPLDGGYVFIPEIKKGFPRFGVWYEKIGYATFAALMVLIFSKDIIHYAGYLGLVFAILVSALFYLLNKKKR